MEHSTIGLIVWILAVALMVVTFIYCMCKGSGGKRTPLHQLHFTSPTPPPATWNTKTETKPTENIGPWFLVSMPMWTKGTILPLQRKTFLIFSSAAKEVK